MFAAAGAIKGTVQGVVGAFASPVSGVLDALSATAEGFNATFGRKRDDSLASCLILFLPLVLTLYSL